MGLAQLNFDGKGKVQVVIDRLRQYEPPEGYYLAFSGGKDSITAYDLLKKAGVKFDTHYAQTGIDPPELVQFIRANYPDVIYHRPEKSMYRWIESKGLPRRQARWCCEKLKEIHGGGRLIITGIRWAESPRRKLRKMVEEVTDRKGATFLHPIIDWGNAEVWEYIKINNIPYCSLYDEGFKRLGCVLCPMTTRKNTIREMERWPKIALAWKHAAQRYYEQGRESCNRWATFEDFWEWWISRSGEVKTEPTLGIPN